MHLLISTFEIDLFLFVVIEHAFHLANASQKCRLLSELYSTELQLFKDMTVNNEGR